MDPTLLQRIIEAALLAAQRPLSVAQLAELFADEQSVTSEAIAQALEALQAACADRGVELVEVASGYRYQVRGDVQTWVSRLWIERQVKYTRATLETLALIAYRQPITRGEIEQVRGVAINTNLIKSLEEREWIRVVGHRDVPGKPALYGTTRTFLDYFGLKSLDQLPPLAELGELTELDPELPFEAAPTVAIIEMGGEIEMESETLSPDYLRDNPDASTEMVSDPISAGLIPVVPNPDEDQACNDAQEQTHD
ncbi:MAG TPA: SMC-Scp complex subunit ScpB [Xanthomonadaceae bacterium]|jgi:segregation and condensation protein B|nr:SMC-Scp complex subunit ScpB [Xanthomonadaceae bacterium]